MDITLAALRREWKRLLGHMSAVVSGAALSLAPPLLFKCLIDEVIPQGDPQRLGVILLGLVILPCCIMGVGLAEQYLRAEVGESVSGDLREATFDHVIHASVLPVEHMGVTEIVHRVTRECGRIGEVFVAQRALPLAASTISFFSTFALMFKLNFALAAMAVLAFPISYFLGRLIERKTRRVDAGFSQLLSRGEAFLQEVLRGIRTMKAFGGEDSEKTKWREWIDRHRHEQASMRVLHDVTATAYSDFVRNLMVGAVYGVGAYMVLGGTLTIGGLVAFAAYLSRAYGSLRTMTSTQIGLQQARVAASRIQEVLDLPQEGQGDGWKGKMEADVAIAFEGVSFSYGDEGRGVQNLDFCVKRGEKVGFVGPSGGGKSTVLHILLGFYEPERGDIRVLGESIVGLKKCHLREVVGLVPQDVFLWDASIRSNLTYGLGRVRDERLKYVLGEVGLEQLVMSSEGLDTMAGDRGQSLSVGERQRIGLARALLKEARILALDEPTSALDAESEAKVMETVWRVAHGRTLLVVSHKLAAVMGMDRIFVIGEGRLLQSGSPSELIAATGHFHDLAKAQALC